MGVTQTQPCNVFNGYTVIELAPEKGEKHFPIILWPVDKDNRIH